MKGYSRLWRIVGEGRQWILKTVLIAALLATVGFACRLSASGTGNNQERIATSVAKTESAQKEIDLVVTGTVLARGGEQGSSTATPTSVPSSPTATPVPPSPTPRPITPTVTNDDTRPGVTVDFDTFPDGSVVEGDIILDGDEYRSQGVLLAGHPVSSYCSDAGLAAIEVPPYATGLPFDFNYLTTSLADDHTACSTVPVEIDFVDLVSKVEIEFIGCEEDYYLRAFDDTGEPLGTVSKPGNLDQHSTIVFTSEAENIDTVTFGREYCGTLVKQIYYRR